ncbi:hypothetical protein [Actinomadura sp. WMMA1423]|uniref:hypothetical protein n=1 Tax=Actinomadura sp. WMMA1423 TaxID=2591108 RepID=UPI001146F17C|nr:hypothetical protein [Actinomadura sp. WMMA1423]
MNLPGAMLGFLVGGAAGFMLTEAVGVFFHFVLDRTLDVGGTPVLLTAFISVPILCAVAGAFVGARIRTRG